MSEKPDDDERSLYLKLFLGLLPFDVDITAEVLNDLLVEADNTSWPSVMRRSANLGLVLSTIGIAGVLILLFDETGFSNTPLGNLGAGYKLGIAIVVLMWVTKFLLGLMQNIDTGDSPIVPKERSTLLTSFLEFVIGVCFIGVVTIPLYDLWDRYLLLALLVAIAAVGFGICGICLTLGGAFDFISRLNGSSRRLTLDRSEE